MLDGVYVRSANGGPAFVPAPPLTDADVQRIVETTARRVIRLLQRRGLLEAGAVDPFSEDEPLLAQITSASVQGVVATGERAGRRVRRRLSDPEDGVRCGRLCFAARGFSLHAATRVSADDRQRLERPCRYVMRPPLASGRLRLVDGATLAFTLKTPWADGTKWLLLSPQELDAGGVSRSWRRWYRRRVRIWSATTASWLTGRWGGAASSFRASPDRPQIVPGPSGLTAADDRAPGEPASEAASRRAHRVSWAELLARVFEHATNCTSPSRGDR